MARLVLTVVGLLFFFSPSGAVAAPHWSDGPSRLEISNINCPSSIFGPSYYETEVGAYLGQYVDGDIGSPAVGEVFDIHLVVSTLGNECAGTRPALEIALPPGVRPALGAVGIRCFIRAGSSGPFDQVSAAQGCPSSLTPGATFHPSIGNWYSLNPEPGSPAAPAWPMAQGVDLEIRVPVVSDRVLNGFADTSGCVCAVASIETINGTSMPESNFTFSHSFPQFGPYVNLFVFPPKPRLVLQAPVRAGKLRAGKVSARVTGLLAGDRVKVALKRSGRVVARASGKAKAGSLRMVLRPVRKKAALRQIKRGKKVTATAVVQRAGKAISAPKQRIKLR